MKNRLFTSNFFLTQKRLSKSIILGQNSYAKKKPIYFTPKKSFFTLKIGENF